MTLQDKDLIRATNDRIKAKGNIARVQNCPDITILVSHGISHGVSHGYNHEVSHRGGHEVVVVTGLYMS